MSNTIISKKAFVQLLLKETAHVVTEDHDYKYIAWYRSCYAYDLADTIGLGDPEEVFGMPDGQNCPKEFDRWVQGALGGHCEQ